MVWCSVKNCRNNSIEKDKENHIKFHQFPKDSNLCKIWVKACNKKNINLKYAKICSVHFDEDSYELRGRILNDPLIKRKLRASAIPTLLLPVESNKTVAERTMRLVKRIRKKDVENLLIESENKNQEMDVDLQDLPNHLTDDRINNTSEKSFVDVEIQTEANLDCAYVLEVFDLRRQISELKQKCLQLENENNKLKNESLMMDSSLKEIFTDGQLKKLKTPQNKHFRWNLQDISSAVCLYSAGPRCYRYLYKKKISIALCKYT